MKKDEEIIENLLKKFREPINAKNGKVWCPYKGSEKHIISALEKILELTKSA